MVTYFFLKVSRSTPNFSLLLCFSFYRCFSFLCFSCSTLSSGRLFKLSATYFWHNPSESTTAVWLCLALLFWSTEIFIWFLNSGLYFSFSVFTLLPFFFLWAGWWMKASLPYTLSEKTKNFWNDHPFVRCPTWTHWNFSVWRQRTQVSWSWDT